MGNTSSSSSKKIYKIDSDRYSEEDLFKAIFRSDITTFKEIMKQDDIDLHHILTSSDEIITPLLLAVVKDHEKMFDLLIKAGADPDFHPNGKSPIEILKRWNVSDDYVDPELSGSEPNLVFGKFKDILKNSQTSDKKLTEKKAKQEADKKDPESIKERENKIYQQNLKKFNALFDSSPGSTSPRLKLKALKIPLPKIKVKKDKKPEETGRSLFNGAETEPGLSPSTQLTEITSPHKKNKGNDRDAT